MTLLSLLKWQPFLRGARRSSPTRCRGCRAPRILPSRGPQTSCCFRAESAAVSSAKREEPNDSGKATCCVQAPDQALLSGPTAQLGFPSSSEPSIERLKVDLKNEHPAEHLDEAVEVSRAATEEGLGRTLERPSPMRRTPEKEKQWRADRCCAGNVLIRWYWCDNAPEPHSSSSALSMLRRKIWWTGLDSNQRRGNPGRFTVCCL